VIVRVFEDKDSLSEAAAEQASAALRRAILDRGCARIIVATGTSQLDFLDALTNAKNIRLAESRMFHLDEYIGLPITHPASFRKYLLERLIHKVAITRYHLLDGDGDPDEVVRRVGEALQSAPVDIAFAGIGENGHLAFNDPPADFQTEEPYLVVTLDEACRRQQVGEAWFAIFRKFPTRPFPCQCAKSSRRKKLLPSFRICGRPKRLGAVSRGR